MKKMMMLKLKMNSNKEKKLRPYKKNKSNKITQRKRKKLSEPAVILPQLPEEIIFEITSRLPLGYRLKFRCVCKSWSIRFHNSKQIVLTGGNEVYNLDNDSLTSPLLDVTEVHGNKIKLSLASTELLTVRSSFAVTCNGLICVVTPDKLFCLWNPFRNEYKLIPKPPSEFTSSSVTRTYGFGYDSNSDDYKVVRITSRADVYQPKCVILSKCVIYSLRSKAWKQIQHMRYKVSKSQQYGVFCNGALHWFAKSRSTSKLLIALNMTDEITREIPKPDNLDVSNYEYRCIGVLDGCLCMLFSSSTGFEVWVMKDYGNRESWTKIYFIATLKLLKRRPLQYLRKIECLKTGELLLEVQVDHIEDLVLYDPKSDRAKVLTFERNPGFLRPRFLFQTYEKSVVTLHSGTYFRDNNAPVLEDIRS